MTAGDTVPLGEIADVKLGKMLDKGKRIEGRLYPYLRNVNVRWGEVHVDDVLQMPFTNEELERFGLREGDVLVCEGGEPGRAAVWAGQVPEIKFQKALHRVRFKGDYEPKLLVYYLESLAKAGRLERRFTGSTIKHFTREAFVQLPVPIFPIGEQRAIVAEIEKQLTRLDAAVAALRRVQGQLKRYRAAVLKAAFEGRLVPTEAELAGEVRRTFVSGVALVEQIATTRRERWPGRGHYQSPSAPSVSHLPAPPAGWAWTTLDGCAEVKGGVTIDQKRKHTSPARVVPYLRVANVQRGYLDLREVKQVEASDTDIDLLALRPGDVLFNEGGDRDKLGRGWIWNGELPVCIHQNHVFRARLFSKDLNPKFVSWYANTAGQQFFFDEGKHTTNLASISMSKLKALPIPIPPPSEQHRIVAEVERRFSVIDELEATVAANVQRAARLRQSVLDRAFRGELVK